VDTENYIQQNIAKLWSDGYFMIPSVLEESQLTLVNKTLQPQFDKQLLGRNDFEGFNTQRIYALLKNAPDLAFLAEHPLVLQHLDHLLMPNYLLNAFLSIKINPGESAQGLHYDDQYTFLSRPRQPLGYSFLWVIDEFTVNNGATVILPKSHRWNDRHPRPDDERMKVCAPAGSLIAYPSTLWHGGGANESKHSRNAIAVQYCQPWVRPQENQFLSVAREKVPTFSPKMQSLLGYSILPPFVGHSNGLHPAKTLPQLD